MARPAPHSLERAAARRPALLLQPRRRPPGRPRRHVRRERTLGHVNDHLRRALRHQRQLRTPLHVRSHRRGPAVSDATAISTSLVIPAYNESARLAAGYERLRDVLDTMDLERTEVVVVDDGSRDDTLRVAHEVYGHLAHTQFVQQPVNRGKGAAVRLGISVATGDRVLTSDADLSIRPRHFRDFLEALDGCDVAPGSRIKEGSSAYESLLRTVAGKTFNLLVRHYTGTKMHDTQCGAKAFRLGPARVLGLLGFL